jgi:lyso-ornithine lipid O-acyltransferase
VALGLALMACVVHFWLMRLRAPLTPERRALWLKAACKRVMSALGVRSRIHGRIPARGLVVSNHLGYLDILIYSAAMPCAFISKAEIGRWPYFGWAARTGGTIFLDRMSRASADSVARQMSARFALPVPVLLFPEGTSTDGSQVRRFHARLIEPAVAAGAPLIPAAICYVSEDGMPERELCWYGDMLFLPHLWKVLGARGISAEVHFAEPRIYASRREAAQAAHDEIAEMRAGFGRRETSLRG